MAAIGKYSHVKTVFQWPLGCYKIKAFNEWDGLGRAEAKLTTGGSHHFSSAYWIAAPLVITAPWWRELKLSVHCSGREKPLFMLFRKCRKTATLWKFHYLLSEIIWGNLNLIKQKFVKCPSWDVRTRLGREDEDGSLEAFCEKERVHMAPLLFLNVWTTFQIGTATESQAASRGRLSASLQILPLLQCYCH